MLHKFMYKIFFAVFFFFAITFLIYAQSGQGDMMNMQGMKGGHMMNMRQMRTHMDQMKTQMNSMANEPEQGTNASFKRNDVLYG